MRNFITLAAVIGLSLAAVGGAQAGGRGQVVSHSSPIHSSFNHSGSFDPHFNYVKFGVRSVNYSYRLYDERYGCYLYWSPTCSCWYFYVPTCSYYVPVQYFSTVYLTPRVQPLLIPSASAIPLAPTASPVNPINPPAPAN